MNVQKKGVIFVQNSINSVYHVPPTIKMSTSLHAIFNVVSGIVDFVMVISNVHDRKMRFPENSQNSMSEKSIFGHFEVLFLNV